MITKVKDIIVTRGDSKGFNFRVRDRQGQATTLDGATFSVKENLDDSVYVFQKTLSLGISQLDNGDYYVKIEPADTEGLELQKYYYDLQIEIGDDVYTPLKGRFDVRWDVTE
ncbi:MAG: hypothetical protein IJ426_00055 [Clostridia bacterium]|nr:hypothetical protein [Clostridia bacterium]